MKFNQLMKQARIEKGFTQQNVAEALEVTINTIQNWEKDEYTKPSYDLIPAIAKVYGLDKEDIIKALVEDVEPDNEQEKVYSFMPQKMFDFKLTKEEQEVLGVLYLRYMGTDTKLMKGLSYNPFVMSNILDSLVDKKLMETNNRSYSSSQQKEYVYGSLSELGLTVCEIIKKNPDKIFNIRYLEFVDVYELFEYFDLENHKYMQQKDDKKYYYDILKKEKHKCNYYSYHKEYYIDEARRISFDTFQKYVPEEYYKFIEMENDDTEYLTKKAEYKEKKKYYDEHKNDIEMLKSLTKDREVQYLEEPKFNVVTSYFIVPTKVGREFGNYIKSTENINQIWL
ncbi:helix-turn-helix transcriptional regulator [uncultured Clostridium sp.]|uniref:helix-turn-helix transcriptional regulator n=1 Tax=uncultured Clostridium sp. TaxID=59620 RepID=UPI0025D07E19|nr:helix-turn-helix transcriptional regulator [uncultured Clostridium sp.]